MQETRAGNVFQILQRRHQHVQIVAVDWADVIETQLLEQGTRHDHAFHVFLGLTRQFPDARHAAEDLLAFFAYRRINLARQNLGQIIVQRTDIRRNRHIVIVQDHQQIRVDRTGMIHRLEGHAAGDAAVADDRDAMLVLAAQAGSDRHAQRRADRRARMADAEGIVFAFRTVRKRANAVAGADRRHALLAPGQNLMWIGLMADIPNQLIARRIEYVMQRHGQLHGTEACREMPAGNTDRVSQELTQFFGKRF
jgi:hypothetical protein